MGRSRTELSRRRDAGVCVCCHHDGVRTPADAGGRDSDGGSMAPVTFYCAVFKLILKKMNQTSEWIKTK